jgi:NADPH:quinone reductase-like Zn-dependent oxidoreductase
VTPRIVRFHEFGGPEVLRLEDAAPEPPGPGEVLIAVEAIGLNNSEAQLRRGDYPMLRATLPSRIGRECVGRVQAVGDGVTAARPGDRVCTIPAFDVRRHGVYGEWCVVPEAGVVPAPLPGIEAAGIWQQYLTAYGPLVEHGRCKAGDVVVVTAAASSVGLGAVQMARALGCTVIGTTRSPTKAAAIRAAGAEAVVIADGTPLAPRLREAAGGRGADLILDPVAGAGIADLAEALRAEGMLFLYGQLAPEAAALPLLTLLRNGLTIRGYTLWEITLNPPRLTRARDFIAAEIATGALRPVVDRVFPLDAIVEAHAYLESGKQAGKILVEVAR